MGRVFLEFAPGRLEKGLHHGARPQGLFATRTKEILFASLAGIKPSDRFPPYLTVPHLHNAIASDIPPDDFAGHVLATHHGSAVEENDHLDQRMIEAAAIEPDRVFVAQMAGQEAAHTSAAADGGNIFHLYPVRAPVFAPLFLLALGPMIVHAADTHLPRIIVLQ